MWKWDEFFQGNPDLNDQVKEKLKRNRECMHKCVEALFDPMLGALDGAKVTEAYNPDDVPSTTLTNPDSSQGSSLSRTSSTGPSQASAFSLGSHDSDLSYVPPNGSQGSEMSDRDSQSSSTSDRSRSLSPNPVLPTTGMDAIGGGSSIKKTRKYRIKHKSNNNRRKRTRKNMKRNMKRNIKRTITNKKSRFNMNTRKIKNRRFYKNK